MPLLALSVAIGLVLSACGGGVSKEEYQTEVNAARDRVDAALGNVVASETYNQVLRRLDRAGAETREAATQLDELGAPRGLREENDDLVVALRSFADELDATGKALKGTVGQNLGRQLQGLNFETWKDVQAALRELRNEGIEVQPLQPKSPPPSG